MYKPGFKMKEKDFFASIFKFNIYVTYFCALQHIFVSSFKQMIYLFDYKKIKDSFHS